MTPWARAEPGEDIVGMLTARGFEALALTPGGGSVLREIAPAARTAVLLGAEGPGLPVSVMAATKGVRIPMAHGFDSLNVATTAAIVLDRLRNP